MIRLTLPTWIHREIKELPQFIPNIEDRMRTIIHFSQLNIDNETGGPFAAGVFERDTGKIIAIGVNRVMPCNCSSAHAEIMALSLAQQKLHTYDLGGPGIPVHQLVVNWRPCVMCYGALLWSGIRSLAIAGSGPELEDITGFDEGPMHVGWRAELEKRGIELIENVLKEEACKVYIDFSSKNSFVYNSRLGK